MINNNELSILLVEDNGLFITIAEEMLSEHNVTSVTTAKDGLTQYKQQNPDITFLDITLPDGNGHDLLNEIKKLNPKAFVIMLTASRLKDDVLKSMDEGAEGYIMKPFSNNILQKTIKEYYEYKAKGKAGN